MILVDSSIWIDYFRGSVTAHTDQLDRMLDTKDLAVGDLILTEVLRGFTSDLEFEKARRLMIRQPSVVIGGSQVALKAAQNFRSLRRRGITIRKTIDTLIATRCIVDNIPLLYSDRDFDPFVEHLGLMPCPAK
ncbi:type II toxin-antitoxin system VapC family toxin [Sphingomonas sp. LT1P40]|uniref:type II toxin-antitoxin system VapC family toxin n=1 Tax=Alteristakelama amylovorans TaxID=3096166 RepID=UPI002FCB60B2